MNFNFSIVVDYDSEIHITFLCLVLFLFPASYNGVLKIIFSINLLETLDINKKKE